MKKITTLIASDGSTYIICYDADEGMFWGIPSEAVENGRLIRPMSRATGHCQPSVAEVIQQIEKEIQIESYVKLGYSVIVAVFAQANQMSCDKAVDCLRAHGVSEEYLKGAIV